MKITYLLIGVLVGGGLGFWGAKSFSGNDVTTGTEKPTPGHPDSLAGTAGWKWADSLDAVKIAPKSHQIVFEDSTVRVLRVTLEPGTVEPVHTHQWKSIMWFTQAVPMTYYRFGLADNGYAITDSFQIPQMPPAVLNHGDTVGVEEPHAIKNTGNREGIAYRIEFKKEPKP